MRRGRPTNDEQRARIWRQLHSAPSQVNSKLLRHSARVQLDGEVESAVRCGGDGWLALLIDLNLLRFHDH